MQQVRIDFDNPGLPQSLGVVEGESQSRIFQAALYKSGAAYTAPAGAVYSIMYRGFGPQNQGWYDTIEDGAGKRAACTVSGNVVTCELVRQAIRVPGHLTVVLCVSDAKGYMLKNWPIMADVRNDGYEDTGESEMYFNLSGIAGNYLTQLEKAMTDAETTRNNLISTSAQAKKDIDAKAAAALKTIPESYTELDGSVKQLKEDLNEYVHPEQEIYKGSINQKYSFTASVLQGNIIVVEKIDATNFSGNFITVKCYSVYQDKPDKLRLVLNIRQYDSENNNLGSVDISSSYSAKMKIYPNTSYLQIRYYFEHTFSSMENVSFGYKGLHLYKGPLLLNKTIKVQKDLENLYSKIPTYYREHIKGKADYINNLWTAKDKKIIKSFAFITDFHGDAYYQTFNSQYLLKYLVETTPMDAIINGGDLITPPVESPYNYQECMAKIREYSDNSGAEAGCEYYFVAGNHDTGVNYKSDGQPTEKIIGQHELFSSCRNTRNTVVKDEKCPLQYYFDEENNKLRFIVLTGGLGELLNSETMQESLLWFAKALQSAPNGYTIIIITHIIWTDKEHHTNAFTEKVFSYMRSYYNRSYVQETVDGERVDFGSCKGTIACLIGGHTHYDYSITNDKGQPIFTTTTDNFQAETGSLKRYGNDVTEQAFDVVSIDTTNRKIYCTRIGAGSNREFSY